jgi:hypothetical protein
MILVTDACIIIVDDSDTISVIASTDFSKRSVEAVAVAKMASLEEYIERIRIDELPEVPRPRDCESIRDEPGNCPNDRARGPPHSIHIGFSHKPGLHKARSFS